MCARRPVVSVCVCVCVCVYGGFVLLCVCVICVALCGCVKIRGAASAVAVAGSRPGEEGRGSGGQVGDGVTTSPFSRTPLPHTRSVLERPSIARFAQSGPGSLYCIAPAIIRRYCQARSPAGGPSTLASKKRSPNLRPLSFVFQLSSFHSMASIIGIGLRLPGDVDTPTELAG